MTNDIYMLKALAQLLQIQTAKSKDDLHNQTALILQLTNIERVKSGLKPVVSNSTLNRLAEMKSKDMVEKDYFSHQSPTYGSAFDMLRIFSIHYLCAGENLALNCNAEHAHHAWMKSPAHQKNILHPSFAQIGIGVYPKGNGNFAYTQLFIG